MRTWNATQTRHLPVLDAALPMDRIESAQPGSTQIGRDTGRRRR